jgi:peptide/nickel transport system substrate-binding protein
MTTQTDRRTILKNSAAFGAAMTVPMISGAAISFSASAADLTIGLAADIGSFDPHNRYLTTDIANHRHVFEPLVFQDERQQVVPGLSTSWKVVDDTTWEFQLRKGVKFHDGSDFTVEDVIATIKRVPKVQTTGGFSFFTSQIIGMQAVDSHTFRTKTKSAYPLMPMDLSQIFIVPKRIAESAQLQDFNSGKAAIGTGPYKLVSYAPGDRIIMEANPNHWAGKPAWDRLTFRIITNDAARVAALLAGDVDVIEKVPTTEFDSLEKNSNISIYQSVSNRVIFLYLDQRDQTPFVTDNAGKPFGKNPLGDRRVREAISKAINRKAIVEKVMENQAVAAGQVLPDGFFGVSPNLKPDGFDPEQAKKLLKEAGYKDGFKLTIHGPNDRYVNDAKIVEAIAQMLTRVGIISSVDTMPKSVFFKRASNLEFSVNLQGWGSTGEASSVLRALMVTHNNDTGMGTFNISRYSNPKLDELVATADVTVDDQKRAALLAEATEIGIHDYALIPLHYQLAVWATRKGLSYAARTDEFTLAMSVSRTK